MISTTLATDTRRRVDVQNGVVTDGSSPQLHPQPLKLIANFSRTLRAAFAGYDAGACSNKVAAERHAYLAAALHSDQFALESLAQTLRSSLRRVRCTCACARKNKAGDSGRGSRC